MRRDRRSEARSRAAGAITCTGSPSCMPKRVRSASCRRTTSFSALSSAPDRARPTSATRTGCCRPSPAVSGDRAATAAAARRTAAPTSRRRLRSISIVHALSARSVSRWSPLGYAMHGSRIAGHVPHAKALPDEVRCCGDPVAHSLSAATLDARWPVRFVLSRSRSLHSLSSPRADRIETPSPLRSPTSSGISARRRARRSRDPGAGTVAARVRGAGSRHRRRRFEGLARAGFGRGDPLAFALPEGPEMAVAVLSVSGCASACRSIPRWTKRRIGSRLRRFAPTR